MTRLYLCLLRFGIVIALLVGTGPTYAEEVITRYFSELTVNRDSSVAVTETITFNVEGNQIKRGILRDFPTRYKTPDGKNYEAGFEVVSVSRDGKPEPYGREDIANGVRLKIGRGDVVLEPGRHTYEIRYQATGELGFFERYDEIYWNVTGNAWTLPIETAEIVIHLPPGASVLQHAGYTGVQGSIGQDVQVNEAAGTTYRALTTRRLEVSEGFTVAVGFSKGVVVPPPPPPDTTITSYGVLGGGVALLFAYYVLTWFRVGRDPSAGPVIPLFYPPAALGPAGVRFIWKRVFDEKSFASAMIGLAAKGRASIAHDKDYVITRLANKGPDLTETERVLYRQLPKTLTVGHGSAETLGEIWSSLLESIKADYDQSTYMRNRKWFWLGMLLSGILIVIALAFVQPDEFAVAFLVVYVCGAAWAVVLWLMLRGLRLLRRSWAVALLLLAIIVPLALFGGLFQVALLAGVTGVTAWIYIAALVALAAMHIAFVRLLPAHTVMGAKLKSEVEGLRLYLATAEEKRLDALNPPDKTPELFERLLPYALALDCENQWSERFASVLAAASYAGPQWYQGASFLDDMDGFGRSLGTNRQAPSSTGGGSGGFTTSSSSWSPGSFSGSSGGGSSGGGGGGGGGSGW